jgi:hypothetical protein
MSRLSCLALYCCICGTVVLCDEEVFPGLGEGKKPRAAALFPLHLQLTLPADRLPLFPSLPNFQKRFACASPKQEFSLFSLKLVGIIKSMIE